MKIKYLNTAKRSVKAMDHRNRERVERELWDYCRRATSFLCTTREPIGCALENIGSFLPTTKAMGM